MQNSPKYQKSLQRFMRMNPSQRAIFDAGLIHAKFADENMRRRLRGMRDAATNLERTQNVEMGRERLGLARQGFEADTSIKNRQTSMNERDARGAEILGLGSAALDTYQGYQGMKNKMALAKKYKGLTPLLYEGV